MRSATAGSWAGDVAHTKLHSCQIFYNSRTGAFKQGKHALRPRQCSNFGAPLLLLFPRVTVVHHLLACS